MNSETPVVVIDSSIAVKWFLSESEEQVGAALQLLADHAEGRLALAAPEHLLLEVLNALLHRGVCESDLAAAANHLLGAQLNLCPLSDLAPDAAHLAARHGITLYDAAFAALAKRHDAELITADRKLAACGACRVRSLA